MEPVLPLVLAASGRRGPDYVSAREALLSLGPELDAALQEGGAEAGWTLARVIEILQLWRADPALCGEISGISSGLWLKGPGIPLGGSPAPWSRAQEIAGRGPAAVPRVIELLYFERGWSGQADLNALLTAALLLADPRAVEPIVSLLDELGGHPREQALCAETLGRWGHPAARVPLLRLLGDPRAGREARGEAARWAGIRGYTEAVPALREIFLDRAQPVSLRADAASSLGRLGGDQAATTLIAHLEIELHTELLQRMAEALGETGSPLALPALRRLAREHPDRFVRRDAAAAGERLTARLAGSQPPPSG